MPIAKWESFLEKHIEGFFNNKFGTELKTAEIEKQIERKLLQAKQQTEHGSVLPPEYEICINKDDYIRLCSNRIINSLYASLEKAIIVHDFYMEGKLHLSFCKKENAPLGFCEIKTFARQINEPVAKEENISQNTITVEASSREEEAVYPIVSLTVIAGPDRDSYLEFGEKTIYLGRRMQNEFILTDHNASRLHAYIAYERHRHIIYDAGSMNGTKVNGQDIAAGHVLQADDEIELGNTVLLYEVI